MTIELGPETEALVRKRLETGAFASPEEVIGRALELLSQQDWLAENRHQIAVEIQEGWDEAQSGTLMQAEEARANLQTRKRDWSKH
jgi:Arc/MetJ-type ribon-helix-helix transcriptional regulator